MTYNVLMGTLNPTHSLTYSSDLEMQDMQGQTFLVALHNYAPTVWPRTIKFAMVTLVWEGCLSRA